jgi:hypothetical protein
LSGGAIAGGLGNIVGGLAESITKSLGSKIPILGKAFVQPVFVTNLGPGGLGGGGGAGGGGVKGAGLLTALGAVAIPAILEYVQSNYIQPGEQGQANANADATSKLIASGDIPKMEAALAGLKSVPDSLSPIQRALYELNANGVKVHTETLEAALAQGIVDAMNKGAKHHGAETGTGVVPSIIGGIKKSFPLLKLPGIQAALKQNIARLGTLQGRLHNAKESGDKRRAAVLQHRIERVSTRVDAEKRAIATAVDQSKRAADAGLTKVNVSERNGTSTVAGAMENAASLIVAAIYANKPVINSTTIVRSTVRNGRAGPSGGSSNTNRTDSGHYAVRNS